MPILEDPDHRATPQPYSYFGQWEVELGEVLYLASANMGRTDSNMTVSTYEVAVAARCPDRWNSAHHH